MDRVDDKTKLDDTKKKPAYYAMLIEDEVKKDVVEAENERRQLEKEILNEQT